MEIFISIAVFILIGLVFGVIVFLLRRRIDPESIALRKKITEISGRSKEERLDVDEIDIIKKRRPLSNIPWLNKVFWKIPLLPKIDLLLLQANVKYPLGVFILISCVLASVGFIFVSFLRGGYLFPPLVAAILGVLPIVYLSMKKKKRMGKFERQLPEALDLIGRSLKAGHAFTGGLQMVAEEFEDPIGSEFSIMLDEINYGVSMKEALEMLIDRVECDGLRFFAVSLNIQRETGGDLCEILGKISYVIRERFKLSGRVRILAAEGKLSAAILIAIPFLVGFAISILNPGYIKILRDDPLGKIVVSITFFMMVMGVIAMKKIVTIKV